MVVHAVVQNVRFDDKVLYTIILEQLPVGQAPVSANLKFFNSPFFLFHGLQHTIITLLLYVMYRKINNKLILR